MRQLIPFCALLLLGNAAWGQPESRERTSERTTVRKATAILGAGVTVRTGDVRLGKVVDLVLNDGGCVEFLVVEYEDSYLAVPWAVVAYEVEQRRVVITREIRRERLKELTFSRDRWPNLTEARYTERLRAVWGDGALRRQGGEGSSPDRPGTRDRKEPDRRPPESDKDRKPPADRKDTTDRKPPDRKDPADRDKDRGEKDARPNKDDKRPRDKVPDPGKPRPEPPR